MKTLEAKTLVYDSNCPMCSWYTAKMISHNMIGQSNRLAFEQADAASLCKLDMNRARHEIPMIDERTGEVLYGLDGLTLIVANTLPVLRPLITCAWFRALLRPLYYFISYNRRIIAGAAQERTDKVSFAPDFNLRWRLALIATGFTYTAWCVYTFAWLMALNPLVMLACVTLYFLLLLSFDLTQNGTAIQKWDYLGHLAVLGFIEGTLFVLTALLAKVTGLTGLMFAGQGAGRLLAILLHAKRVGNNNYARSLNFAFTAGAIALVIFIAVLKK
jgi:predicted DCC family thiol-disulfide oxidoreductase YuxK